MKECARVNRSKSNLFCQLDYLPLLKPMMNFIGYYVFILVEINNYQIPIFF